MDDFVVERFDPTRVAEPTIQNNEAQILAKLKEKINKRKLKAEEDKQKQPEEQEPSKKKKKQKRKVEPEPEPAKEEDYIATAAGDDSTEGNADDSTLKATDSSTVRVGADVNSEKKETKLDSGYQTLGMIIKKKPPIVKRDLPYWLLNPDINEIDYLADQLPIAQMKGLDTVLTDKLIQLGFKHYFPVQRQIIPYLLEPHPYRPHDVCVSAPTGSGKTLAFILPVIQALSSRIVPKVRAIIVLPTHDLAQQIFRVISKFVVKKGLKVKLLCGQTSFAKEQSQLYRLADTGILHQLADILVVTPGRLVRHIRGSKDLDLTALRYLVIDEADRMINEISNEWLTFLESAVFSKGRSRPGPLTMKNMRKRELPLQKMLFSATLGRDPEKLEQINLFEPKLFRCIVPPKDLTGKIEDYGLEDIGDFSVPAELKQYKCTTEIAHKPLMVKMIMDKLELNSALVFTKSKEATHRLSLVLKHLDMECAELTSTIQAKRNTAINKLKSREVKILVCSDVLARGIDIENLDAVISYDCPDYLNTYIHRIGRTARAGRQGTAITLIEPSQTQKFGKLNKEANIPEVESLEMEVIDPELKQKFTLALDKTRASLIEDHNKEMKKKQRI